MSIEQIVVLAIVQGITEFLPISSSGHLILIPALTGWPDQGLITDVMVHVGSLFAILAYFWRDVLTILKGCIDLARLRWTWAARLAAYIIVGTIPAVIVGLIFKLTGFLDYIRGVEIVAWNAIIFGILLYVADAFGPRLKSMAEMRFGPAIIIGIAQSLALVPGTSRSGITMTAARAMGFKRDESARFSFLLGVPAITAAGLLTFLEAYETGEPIPADALYAAGLTFFSALAAIAFLMAIVKRMSFLPFVIYRLALALALFALIYGWIPGVAPPA
ncbi:undecaprenyl-diphosphate phosphatase [Rhodobium gokarnense]|uniref:Undecaprenyl-diphosphatase n=1 Tax=Rhodobium gokarnense TaxID=364296 RepID=A0ABT3HGZ9_9HYPH|nr:undecaprenyl-diphosphate phosphatase [Rhodobium gokarnense]MCW2309650.1 undecaprenyl-diphosphatase [Rhodobium gokarnense]